MNRISFIVSSVCLLLIVCFVATRQHFIVQGKALGIQSNATSSGLPLSATIYPKEVQLNGTPQEVVMAFYKEYEDCLAHPPEDIKGVVGDYCQNHSIYRSTGFYSEGKKDGNDPFFCSRDIPRVTQLGRTVVRDNDSTIYVVLSFEKGEVQTAVSLIREMEQWRIKSIQCPRQE